MPESHVVLVTGEGTSFTTETVEVLEKAGNRVVVLDLPSVRANPAGKNRSSLKEVSDVAIGDALNSIRAQYGEIGAFIHLHPSLKFSNGNFAQHFKTERSILKSVFLLARHLYEPLTSFGKQQRAAFLTISQMDGALGHGKRGDISVLAGGLRGLVKSLNLEWPSVFCRSVDLDPELSAADKARHVLAEWHDADVSLTETGYAQNGRQTIMATPVEVAENAEIKTTLSKEAVLLVSGGAKGVTATCVKELAQTFQCKFILLGRSSNDFVLPDYAKEDIDDSTLKRRIMEQMKAQGEAPALPKVRSMFNQIRSAQEIQQTLAAIRSAGAEVAYIQGDVTNPASFREDLKQVTDRFGAVSGIIHGAGRLADKYIQDKTETDFDNVLSVKLEGLLSLLKVVNIGELKHLFLFSSVAGFYGNVGQTDYALANEILNTAAQLFKTNHPETHVSAINWGAWDGGMVSAALKKQFEAAGVSLVNSEGGAAMCVNEFNEAYFNEAQVIIGGTLPSGNSYLSEDLKSYVVGRKLKLKENPFLQHHVIQGNAVLPVVNAGGWMAQTCEKLFPDFQVFKVEDMQLFKGIVFSDEKEKDCLVELKEVNKSPDQLRFEVTVSSRQAGKKLPTYHYKAKVSLVNKKKIPTAASFNPEMNSGYPATGGEDFYRDGSLFHGTYFQGIGQILDWDENQVIMSCKAPMVPKEAQGQFPVRSVNTFFSDIQYQGMVLWVQKYHQGAKSLPLSTDSVTLYQAIPFDRELFVHIKIVESTAYKLVADCTTYDTDGKIYMITKGAAVTISHDLKW